MSRVDTSVVDPATKSLIARNLAQRQQCFLSDPALIPSGVLVPVYMHSSRLHLVFTKRHDRLPHHAGQFSFPGGVREPADDTLLTTALREAREEVGIDPTDVEVLGELNPVSTSQGFAITPYVGAIPYPYPFHIYPREVTALLEVPFQFFLNQQVKEMRFQNSQGVVTASPAYEYNGHIIWGATARIVMQFVALIKRHGGKH